MCRGLQNQKDFCRSSDDDHDAEVSSAARNYRGSCVGCELCGEKATLYCQADDAYLCQKCDRWVHGANFLARRHIRCLLCNTCQGFTQRYLVGASMEVMLPTLVGLQQDVNNCISSDDDNEESDSGSLKLPFLFL
ncbi:B-box domain protein 30 [Linum grandiflorum]